MQGHTIHKNITCFGICSFFLDGGGDTEKLYIEIGKFIFSQCLPMLYSNQLTKTLMAGYY